MATDVAASALESLCDVRSGKSSTGGVGFEAGVSAGCFGLRERGIAKMDGQNNPTVGFGIQRDLTASGVTARGFENLTSDAPL